MMSTIKFQRRKASACLEAWQERVTVSPDYREEAMGGLWPRLASELLPLLVTKTTEPDYRPELPKPQLLPIDSTAVNIKSGNCHEIPPT